LHWFVMIICILICILVGCYFYLCVGLLTFVTEFISEWKNISSEEKKLVCVFITFVLAIIGFGYMIYKV